MASFLYKIGRSAFRRRRLVALLWVALLALAGFGAATAPAATSSSFSIPGTEAQRAFDLLEERFPGSNADGATARVVFKAPEGRSVNDPDLKAEVTEAVADLTSGSGQVASVSDPYASQAVSQDGSTAYISVTYKTNPFELTESTRSALEQTGEAAREGGMTVEIGGDALQTIPHTGAGEIVGVVIAAIVLVITFGSLVAAGLPLVTALIGVGIGISGITALASTLDLGTTTSTLAMMIGLAVGIDYALFIVSRYRVERAEGRDAEEAAGRAVGTAGSAVVFAGLTVIIALVGLAVVNIPMLSKMGFAAAGTVAIAVLVALTLIPALLGFAGDRVLGRAVRKALAAKDKDAEGGSAAADGAAAGGETAKPNAGTRWARFVLRRPVVVLLAGVIGLGAVAVPAASLEVGLPDDGSQPVSTTQRKAYDLLSEGFGPGFNGPLVVVVDGDADAAESAAETIRGIEGAAAVTPPTPNKAGDAAMITVIPEDRPSSKATEDLVHDIREQSGDEVYVTGATAMNIDFSQRMNDALLPYLGLVVGLAFLLLMVVFRSILVPLKAALGFLLSVVAALGAVVAVFQWGWLGSLFGVEQTGPIMSMMPIFMIGVVFGLAMDYEVFLVTRMREAYVHGQRPGEAIVTGFRHGARVVTAAAVIMIAVFAGFIGSSEQMIKMIGFGLAIAVVFDAFVVRMAIVPAVLALLGARAWWLPRWLDRVLPDVDVEGDRLRGSASASDGSGEGDADRELARV
ncbi:MMPL family transporter [Streptomyces sp. C10-9-1]|uniref:MMPL family transporter n=1 Tax=Streptomyces sp. C10-9-1 TaxID=1859285 RepID=UPI0021120246|nr:MMPL family transporter [Streptomyces sp. C10-9-1]MCQ6555666.1 MMPL family transporter [Streptomyces sp. C10-9-1]